MTAKKFDFIIGNPPYNGTTTDTTLYPQFMEASYRLGEVVELVTPGRFMFNAGKTRGVTEKIMEDPHIKLVKYYENSREVFPNDVNIKGGVAITLRDAKRDIGPINIIPDALKGIVEKFSGTENLNKRSYGCSSFSWSEKFKKDLNDQNYKESNLHSDCFKKLAKNGVFVDEIEKASSLKPQASSLKPQASSLKPQASSLKPKLLPRPRN